MKLLLLLCLSATPSLTVSAGGDLQLGTHTPAAQLAPLASLLAGDVRFVNLEGPLTASGLESGMDARGTPVGPLRFNAPPATAHWLRGKVNVVSLANNHALDQGESGRAETVALLREQGVLAATPQADAAWQARGRRVRLIARELPEDWPPADEEALVARVVEARQADTVVLVSLHWGRAGATAVLGHGPHTLQGVERHGRGIIAYSLVPGRSWPYQAAVKKGSSAAEGFCTSKSESFNAPPNSSSTARMSLT